MDELRRLFEKEGMAEVESFKASGNIVFDSTDSEVAHALPSIRAHLNQLAGGDIELILRSETELQKVVRLDPFRGRDLASATPYATLFVARPKAVGKVPFSSPKGDVEVIRWLDATALSLAHRIGGRSGFPNRFLEERFGLPATTRNWATIVGVLEAWRARTASA